MGDETKETHRETDTNPSAAVGDKFAQIETAARISLRLAITRVRRK